MAPGLWLAAVLAVGATEGFEVSVDGMRVEVSLVPGEPAVGGAAVRRWVEDAVRDVTEYLGAAPVPRARLRVRTDVGGRIGSGRMFGGDGDTAIRIAVGRRATEQDLAHDWVLTHEMFHLALPDLPQAQSWMEEGLSTYLEPVARARRGRLAPEEMWRGLSEGVRYGLPEAGDPGLDRTQTWGSTYWGGALYWLLADVRIRERTHGRASLVDALRRVRDEGGNGGAHWTTERLIAVADSGTGVPVLRELYDAMGRRPMQPDLPGLWRTLGVSPDASFDDAAPLAELRRAITSAEAAPRSPSGPGR